MPKSEPLIVIGESVMKNPSRAQTRSCGIAHLCRRAETLEIESRRNDPREFRAHEHRGGVLSIYNCTEETSDSNQQRCREQVPFEIDHDYSFRATRQQ